MVKSMVKSGSNILAVLFIATLVRLVLINQPASSVETYIIQAINNSYQAILGEFSKGSGYPPLYFLVTKYFSQAFGSSVIVLRLFSVILGVATVYLTYSIAKLLTDGRESIFPQFAAILVATSQFHIFYSQEGTMYAKVTFLITAAVYLFLDILKHDSSQSWLLFSLVITLFPFSDYPALFMLVVFWFYSYKFQKERRWRMKFAAAHLPLLAAAILWWPIFFIQLEQGKWLANALPFIKNLAGGETLKQAALLWMKFVLGRITYPRAFYYFILVGLASIPFALALFKHVFTRKDKYVLLTFYWLWVPLIVGYFVSFLIPSFSYYRFLYVLPAFYLNVAWAVDSFTILPLKKALVVLTVMINLFGWLTYIADPSQQRQGSYSLGKESRPRTFVSTGYRLKMGQ